MSSISRFGVLLAAAVAVLGDGGDLHPAADTKYFLPGKAKIAIFGHTHSYKIKTGLLGADKDEVPPGTSQRARVIYGNCGTWIDAKPCNFIVTEQCIGVLEELIQLGISLLKTG